jgi:hypothetical protein
MRRRSRDKSVRFSGETTTTTITDVCGGDDDKFENAGALLLRQVPPQANHGPVYRKPVSLVQRFATGSGAVRPASAPNQQQQQHKPVHGHGHSRHTKPKNRGRKVLTSTEKAKREYDKTKLVLRQIPEQKFFFADAGAPHDTDGDMTTNLHAREQRDLRPSAGTANAMNEGRLTLRDDQLTLGSKKRRDSCAGCTAPAMERSPSASTNSSEESGNLSHGSSKASSKHLHDDGTWKNPLSAVMHHFAKPTMNPTPERATLKELYVFHEPLPILTVSVPCLITNSCSTTTAPPLPTETRYSSKRPWQISSTKQQDTQRRRCANLRWNISGIATAWPKLRTHAWRSF